LKIVFVFHSQSNKPAGGPKIIYEYADELAGYGYDVEVLHIAWKYNTTNIIKGVVKYFYFFFNFKPNKWFVFKNNVKLRWRLFPITIHGDFIVATAWETAEIIKNIIKKEQIPIYLIQADESKFDEPQRKHWEQRVLDTWKYPWKKIVIAEFLKNEVEKYDKNVIKILNGLDFSHFCIKKSIIERNIISMIAHRFTLKGTIDGLRALEIVQKKYNKIKVTFFSTYPKMDYIPDWIDYRYNPTQDEIVEIYNNSFIFISPSHTEGFGLPVAEAMACGCCTVITDIPAYHDFTIQNKTSLYSAVGDYSAMANNIITLIEDNALREKLANNGYSLIHEKLSLDKSYKEFLSVIQSLSSGV
jgi:glycosyltransferase involved in cell wall biosynthesis